jgi:hypothetical protein
MEKNNILLHSIEISKMFEISERKVHSKRKEVKKC